MPMFQADRWFLFDRKLFSFARTQGNLSRSNLLCTEETWQMRIVYKTMWLDQRTGQAGYVYLPCGAVLFCVWYTTLFSKPADFHNSLFFDHPPVNISWHIITQYNKFQWIVDFISWKRTYIKNLVTRLAPIFEAN